nr:ATP-binding cassette domain-containing protein [Burkholderiaceae bacterium]
SAAAPVVEVDGIVTRFGANTVHDGVSFAVERGTLVALIGGSGTGKSVLLREIIGLLRPTAGRVTCAASRSAVSRTTGSSETASTACASRCASTAAPKMPSELSGGMRKRAAVARAIALEPEVLFLDEPTSGLDPITARGFDRLVRSLVDDLGVTVLLVTHDLDTLLTVVDRVIVIARGRVLADGPVRDVMAVDDAWVSEYFSVRTMIGSDGS